MGMPYHVSGSNFLVLSVNLIPVPLSLLPVHAPTAFSQFSLCQFTTLTIHSSLSFAPGSRSTSFINLSHHRLHCGLRTDSTDFITDRFFWAPRFLVFFITLFSFGSVQKIKRLFVSFWAHVNRASYRASYHIVYRISQSYSIWRLTPVTNWNAQTADNTRRATFGQLILRKIIKNYCHQMSDFNA